MCMSSIMAEYERTVHGFDAEGVQIIEEISGCSNVDKGLRSLRTYKRKKMSDISSGSGCTLDANESASAANQVTEEIKVEVEDRSRCHEHIGDCEGNINHSNNSSVRNWRNVVLEKMYETYYEDEEGILGCIRDAIKYHPDIDHKRKAKVNSCNEKHKKQNERWSPSSENATSVNLESESDTITAQCQRAFYDVIISENFASLCKLLLENFKEIKINNLLDFRGIHSKMKEGAYEHAPSLFIADIQQLWKKFERIGSEMALYASNLSETSMTSCCKCIKGLAESISEDLKIKESDAGAKLDELSIVSASKVDSCRICSGLTDGKDCLVCDSCEGMYHLACIKPAVEEIPTKSWYCDHCTARGVELPHDGCVVCDRLNSDTRFQGDALFLTDKTSVESDVPCVNGNDPMFCKVCRCEIDKGEKVLVCDHPFCPNKCYHVRCLTGEQMKLVGPTWYCPSCLCRACLTDKDDDMIVLCDGCNDAYHIYCMKPPRSSVPTGKWFCPECETALRRIHAVKRAYEEKFENK